MRVAASIAGCVFSGLLTASCAIHRWREPLPIARTSDEIGNVYVSAYPVVEWADISPALAPARNWKIADAQSAALPVTSAQTFQAATQLGAALGINFPTTSTSGTTPGTVPVTPSLAAPTPSQAPALPALGTLVGLSVADAYQQLVSITALFQQAAILDNQITSQYIPKGYAAHLLTFQINLQPSRRNWSYNALVDITMLPSPLEAVAPTSTTAGVNTASLPPVIIKPAIITDAVEIASNERSLQEIRQALAQLSGSLSSSGAAALLSSGSNSLETSAGYNSNSLITQGVVDDATLRIRLGAVSDGTGRFVLRPRTYNISVLVLTRSGNPAAGTRGIDEIAAVTHTSFSPTDTLPHSPLLPGGYLPTSPARLRPALAASVADKIGRYGYPPLDPGCDQLPLDRPVRTKPFDIDNPDDVFVNAEFLRLVSHGAYATVKRCLRVGDQSTIAGQEQFYRVLSEISEIQETTRYSRLTIPLKNDGTPVLPDARQYAVVSDSDDGKQETVTLSGGRNLTSEDLHPRAALTDHTDAWLLPASVAVTQKPTSVQITFNRPASLQTLSAPQTAGESSADGASKGQLARLELVWGTDYGVSCGNSTHQCYTNFLRAVPVSAAATGPSPQQITPCKSKSLPALVVSAKTVRTQRSSTQGYSGGLNVAFSDLSQLTIDCTSPAGTNQPKPMFQPPYHLVLSNADIVLGPLIPAGANPCLSVVGNQIQVSAKSKCMTALTLSNVENDVPITLSISDSVDKVVSAVSVNVSDVPRER